MVERHFDASIAAFRRAIELNPSSAQAHSHLGRALAMVGRDKEAIAEAEQAIRLSPRDPQQPLFMAVIGLAHCTAGRYEECIRFTGEGLGATRPPRSAASTLCKPRPLWTTGGSA